MNCIGLSEYSSNACLSPAAWTSSAAPSRRTIFSVSWWIRAPLRVMSRSRLIASAVSVAASLIIETHEHEADDITREVLTEVRRTFLTPFDRGAITSLIAAMDDSIDEMHSTAVAIDLYDLREFSDEMKQMVAMISEAATLTAEAINLLRDITRNGAR